MGILEWIKELFNNGKSNVRLITKDLVKIYKSENKLEVGLYTNNNKPLKDKKIIININGRDYERITNADGVASLNINLGIGKYRTLIDFKGDEEYNSTSSYCNVYVNPIIETQNLTMNYKDGSQFKVKIKDYENNPIPNQKATFNINGKDYERTSNEEGVIALNINLGVGEYTILTKIGNIEKSNIIKINKAFSRMEGVDINKTASETKVYQCAVYNDKNERLQGNVIINVNGVDYERTIGEDGLAKLNIRLPKGNYTIKSKYNNVNYIPSEAINKITVVDDVKVEEKKNVKLNPYMTSQGCSGMGQCTGYYCACNSVQQVIYRLTGEKVSESKLASVGGTTSSGTGHEGINTMIAWFNRTYGYNIKISWKNFSEVGWNKVQEYINNGALFMHILYRNKYGHYEVPKAIEGNNVIVLNSLGDRCGGETYCGYIETRSKATHQSYINGISQKSLAIFTI